MESILERVVNRTNDSRDYVKEVGDVIADRISAIIHAANPHSTCKLGVQHHGVISLKPQEEVEIFLDNGGSSIGDDIKTATKLIDLFSTRGSVVYYRHGTTKELLVLPPEPHDIWTLVFKGSAAEIIDVVNQVAKDAGVGEISKLDLRPNPNLLSIPSSKVLEEAIRYKAAVDRAGIIIANAIVADAVIKGHVPPDDAEKAVDSYKLKVHNAGLILTRDDHAYANDNLANFYTHRLQCAHVATSIEEICLEVNEFVRTELEIDISKLPKELKQKKPANIAKQEVAKLCAQFPIY